MQKSGKRITIIGLFFIFVSVAACGADSFSGEKKMESNDTAAEYGTIRSTETRQSATLEETAGGSNITGDIYADARNKQLYMSDGVIVDFDGNVLDQYSGITCLEDGALITEDGKKIENLFVGKKEQIYYALSGAVESASAVEVELIIVNQTGTDICSFYAAVAETDRWGKDLLEGNILCAWDNTSIKCKIGKDTLRWNFAFEDGLGNREEFYDLDLSSCREDRVYLTFWRDDDDGIVSVELE